MCLLGPLLTQPSTLPLQVLLRICGSNREQGTVHGPPGPDQLLDSSTATAATGHPHAKAGWYMLLGTVVSVDSGFLVLYVSHYSFTSKWDNRDPLSISSTLT